MTAEPHYGIDDLPEEIREKIESGEELIFDSSQGPVARVVPLRRQPIRTPGLWKGKIEMADDWDSDEVNEEIARDFGMIP